MAKSFNDKLIELLRKDLRFVDDESGELIRSEIINEALKIDKKLIEALLSEKEIKEKFFTEIKGHWIFEINKFVEFIQDKNFLSDSYTKFKNKIGLNIGGKFLNERKEVSLVWPFKDCVLGGGMTKEDEKRDEIFFNEILAQDEIDRLLDPKVLTNFKRVTVKGEEKVTDFKRDEDGTIRENLIIKGNNLLALHSLRKEFQGKVDLVYIDPPFNTGNDSFAYNDHFIHSTWLTFMKNRLDVAKDLLSEYGSIFVHLDCNEGPYAKVLMDEIFGRENFRNEIVWAYTGPSSPGMKIFAHKHDNIFWYTRSNRWIFNVDEVRLPYKESTQKNVGRRTGWTTGKPDSVVELNPLGKYPEDWWLMHVLAPASKEKIEGFATQKREALLEKIIKVASNKEGLILDFCAGSGTTGAVAHKLGRQYILIEQMDSQIDTIKKRFRNIIRGDQTELSKAVNWMGGGSFIYCELMKFNEEAIDEIKDAKTTEDLLKIWKKMVEHYFLNYDVDIKRFNDNQEEFKKLSLEKQKKLLVEMLNKNQLYVNLSEIGDAQFKVSREDKELNKKFYK